MPIPNIASDSVSTREPMLKLTADLSKIDTKVKFNLFTDTSVASTITANTSTVSISITKTLYPYSVFLKSISVMPDKYGKNGYTSVSLIEPVLMNRKVYSVDTEGSPTKCDSGFILNIQQILNNAYYPNMMLGFNFVDYMGNEFTYYCDDPLVEVDTYDYIKFSGGFANNSLGGIGLVVPAIHNSNYLASLSYITSNFSLMQDGNHYAVFIGSLETMEG
jgi:hypothetical protein